MALGEFELIARYFSRTGAVRGDVVLGVGDDAALVTVAPGHELVVAADTLVAGAHFPSQMAPCDIGYRALAVNLSDLAAMGATPAWFTLALTLPQVDESWLAGFARGLHELAARHGVTLIGGDTTRGPLTISVQVLGSAPAGAAIRRSGARPGDVACVSGTPGDAAAGLALLQGGITPVPHGVQTDAEDRESLLRRFLQPSPRVSLGLALRGLASAAIDVSDGLYADLGKLAAASGVGVSLDLDLLPLSAALRRCAGELGAVKFALTGGDDYELCFTVPATRLQALQEMALERGEVVRRIGVVEARQGVRCVPAGRAVDLELSGYDHFAG